MPNDASSTGFQSILAPFMDQFLQEKRACGYAYHEPIRMLHRLDDFLVQEGLTTLELPRSSPVHDGVLCMSLSIHTTSRLSARELRWLVLAASPRVAG